MTQSSPVCTTPNGTLDGPITSQQQQYQTQHGIKYLPNIKISLNRATQEMERRVQIEELIKEVFPGDEVKKMKTLSGGTSNILYKIKLRNRKRPVLCRINGANSEKIVDRDTELNFMVKVMEELSDSTVHCRFGNGIVYDFLEGVPLETDDVTKHAEGIAIQMARFHQLEMEGDKSPMLFRVLDNWIKSALEVHFEDEALQRKVDEMHFEDRILPEIAMIRKMMDGWDVVFCHNDIIGLNVIFNENNQSYSFIDYEYCGHNYRAFDIGDHFFEHLGLTETDLSKYPSLGQQKRFVRAYLRELHQREPTEREVEVLRRQSNIAGLASNLFWGVWSLYQAKNSVIDFDYLTYGQRRFNAYFQLKDALLQDPDEVDDEPGNANEASKAKDSINGTNSSKSTPIFNSYQRYTNYSEETTTPNSRESTPNVRVIRKQNLFGRLFRRKKANYASFDSSLGGKTSDYYAKLDSSAVSRSNATANHSDDEDEYLYQIDQDAARAKSGKRGTQYGTMDGGRSNNAPTPASLLRSLLTFLLSNSWLYFITFIMVSARSIDFVFYVRLAYKMRNYEFILSGIILSFAFNLITWPIVLFRMYVTGQITPEMRRFPKKKFFFMGLMDSLNVIITTIPAALVSGVVNVVMAQSVIVLNVVMSYFFLNYRFGVAHGLGLFVLCAGIIVAIYPLFLDGDDIAGPLGPFATGVFVSILFLGNLPMAASNCYKELYLKEADLDIYYMNGWIALWQCLMGIILFPMVFIPLPGGAPYVKPAEFGEYFVNAMKCFAGINTHTVLTGAPSNSLDACPGTWLVFVVFIVFNMAYNLLILAVMKRGSSTLAVVASTARLALSNMLFLVRPIAGSSTIDSLSINDIIALVLLIFGILFYGARPEKQAAPDDKVVQIKQRLLQIFCFPFYRKSKPTRSAENNHLADSDTDSFAGSTPGDFGVQNSDDVRHY